MVWKTINGKRKFFPDGNMAQHETRENQTIKRLESDIARLRDPKNAMNPIASASIIKAMQSEIKELKSINQMPEPSPMGAKKFRSEQFFKNHKELQ